MTPPAVCNNNERKIDDTGSKLSSSNSRSPRVLETPGTVYTSRKGSSNRCSQSSSNSNFSNNNSVRGEEPIQPVPPAVANPGSKLSRPRGNSRSVSPVPSLPSSPLAAAVLNNKGFHGTSPRSSTALGSSSSEPGPGSTPLPSQQKVIAESEGLTVALTAPPLPSTQEADKSCPYDHDNHSNGNHPASQSFNWYNPDAKRASLSFRQTSHGQSLTAPLALSLYDDSQSLVHSIFDPSLQAGFDNTWRTESLVSPINTQPVNPTAAHSTPSSPFIPPPPPIPVPEDPVPGDEPPPPPPIPVPSTQQPHHHHPAYPAPQLSSSSRAHRVAIANQPQSQSSPSAGQLKQSLHQPSPASDPSSPTAASLRHKPATMQSGTPEKSETVASNNDPVANTGVHLPVILQSADSQNNGKAKLSGKRAASPPQHSNRSKAAGGTYPLRNKSPTHLNISAISPSSSPSQTQQLGLQGFAGGNTATRSNLVPKRKGRATSARGHEAIANGKKFSTKPLTPGPAPRSSRH